MKNGAGFGITGRGRQGAEDRRPVGHVEEIALRDLSPCRILDGFLPARNVGGGAPLARLGLGGQLEARGGDPRSAEEGCAHVRVAVKPRNDDQSGADADHGPEGQAASTGRGFDELENTAPIPPPSAVPMAPARLNQPKSRGSTRS